jgi:hypothetical protein
VRIIQTGGTQQIIVDGVDLPNADVQRGGTQTKSGTQRRRFVINGITYNDLSEIPDPHLRKVAQDALEKA